jgi:hypothetical protein
MSFPKAAYTAFLFLIGLIAFLSAVVVRGWLSAPFTVVAWGVAYLVENSVRRGEVDDWKGYLGLPIFCFVLFALGLPSVIKREETQDEHIVSFDKLRVSQGVLKKGVSGDMTLIRDNKPSLSLLCGDNAGKGSHQTCIRDGLSQAFGKRVTVYHEPEFKRVVPRAIIYEVRYNGQRLISYDRIVKNHIYRRKRRAESEHDLTIMLFVSTICGMIYVALRRREQLRSQ